MKLEFLSKLKEIKGFWVLFFILLVGILFIILGTFMQSKESGSDIGREHTEAFSRTEYESEIEARLAEIITEIGGISDVSVMVTLDSTVNYSYAENDKSGNSEYVTIKDKDGNESGVLISENAPNVRGVAIVCSGGESAEKRLEIIKLVSALLKLPENRVYVGGRT